MYSDITGIILAGGKSKRMGFNKAFLKVREQYIIEIISTLMKELFERVILITNEPELYKFLGLELFEDVYAGNGPLGGIHSGLIHSNTEKNLIISCDIPLITREIIQYIVEYPTKKDIVVPYADCHVQQLCGVYSKSCLLAIEALLNEDKNAKKCRVLQLIEINQGEIINIDKEMSGYVPNSFLNMNEMAQYNMVRNFYAETLSKRRSHKI